MTLFKNFIILLTLTTFTLYSTYSGYSFYRVGDCLKDNLDGTKMIVVAIHDNIYQLNHYINGIMETKYSEIKDLDGDRNITICN